MVTARLMQYSLFTKGECFRGDSSHLAVRHNIVHTEFVTFTIPITDLHDSGGLFWWQDQFTLAHYRACGSEVAGVGK